jgi:hypothetical protein
MMNAQPDSEALSVDAVWQQLLGLLDRAQSRLMAGLGEVRKGVIDLLKKSSSEVGDPEQPADLGALLNAAALLKTSLLDRPLAEIESTQPMERAQAAFDTFNTELESIVGELPKQVTVTGSSAVEALGPKGSSGFLSRLAQLRGKERDLPFALVVEAEMRKQSGKFIDDSGACFRALALAVRQPTRLWEIARKHLGPPAEAADRLPAQLATQIEAIDTQLEKSLASLDEWPDSFQRGLARALLDDLIWPRGQFQLVGDQRREQEREHRIRLQSAAIEEVRLAQAFANAELQIAGQAVKSLEGAVEERAGLLASLERSVQWLTSTGQDPMDSRFPNPQSGIKTAADRAAEIDAAVERAAEGLPESMTVLVDFAASAESRERERQLHPREVLSRAYARQGRDGVAALFSSIESHHSTISTALERAREVVAYGVKLSRESNPPSPEIALQAKTNSRTLLEHSLKEIPDWAPEANRTLMSLVVDTSSEMSSLLRDDESRHLILPVAAEVRHAVNRGEELPRDTALDTGQTGFRHGEDRLRRWLVRIGWREPLPATAQITRRPLLPKEFSEEISSGRVPAIYRELFRPEAVRDPKLLVGRDEGLAAIAEARELWEEGRPVAVVISGARGSGKTSLINCALPTALHGLEIIRGEFHERLSTADQLRDFLAHSFEIEDPGQLETFLAGRRRVVIIEELERTFLRQVGHYSAIRAIQRLVAATCRSTLWILATNRFAYEFLNASIRLGDSFSHYINTTRVSRETLREAILRRHYLSGLRLEFEDPPPDKKWTTTLNNKIEGALTAEDIFFDRLSRESDGVFRAAFEMWLTHVDSAENGLLKMRPLVVEGLSPVVDTLSMSHLYTLVAILQHGSLNADQHAVVFQKTAAASMGTLNELLTRELIEPDPGRDGFRVAAEARRVVFEALYQRNLL